MRMRISLASLITIFGVLAWTSAQADVQMCTNTNGKITCSSAQKEPLAGENSATTPGTVSQPVRQTFVGLVTQVLDSRTLKVIHAGIPVQIRLREVAVNRVPLERLQKLALRQTVTVIVFTTDFDGRLVSEVRLPDGRSLNREITQGGQTQEKDQVSSSPEQFSSPTLLNRPPLSQDKPVHVKGYQRQDGTYVRPHTRNRPGSGSRK